MLQKIPQKNYHCLQRGSVNTDKLLAVWLITNNDDDGRNIHTVESFFAACKQQTRAGAGYIFQIKLVVHGKVAFNLNFKLSPRTLSSAKTVQPNEPVHIFYPAVSASEPVSACLCCGWQTFLPQGFRTVCMRLCSLTSWTVLEAAGALGHICHLRREHC